MVMEKNLTKITRMLPRFIDDTPTHFIENPFPYWLETMF